jgi:hypothetical protein
MSISSTDADPATSVARSLPSLSVIVASNGTPGAIEGCLASLEEQAGATEVIVCPVERLPDAVLERFPFATFAEPREALVPELWRDGIEAASGEAVALTISPMRVSEGWIATLGRLLSDNDAVGGAIDPGDAIRIRDVAEYFCRYSRDMRPFTAHECRELPGDNAGYRRDALDRVPESFRDGFWEPDVHRALAARSAKLLHTPDLVVSQGRSAGILAFTRQRWRHGRLYGHQRGVHFGRARNLVGVLAAPVVPFLMTFRVARRVFGKRRHRLRLVLASPLVFWFNVVWAVAEGLGHADMLVRR